MYISSHKFFEEDQIRIKYSSTETVSNTDDLKHPILRAILKQFDFKGGLELSSIADVPAGTGMGSSSSFTVGLLHNLYLIKNEIVTKEKLAQGACRVEIELLKEPIGKQDQYAAAYGGFNVFEFNPDGSVTVDPLHLKEEVYLTLEDNLIMFYTGMQRSASHILSEQKKNITHDEKFNILKTMVGLVYELKAVLLKGNLDDFGRLLHENWILKKELASGITNPEVNNAYEMALKNGALGGKLLGAGGGGFLLFYCPRKLQEKLINSLKPLRHFPFKFEQEGSKLIHFSDE